MSLLQSASPLVSCRLRPLPSLFSTCRGKWSHAVVAPSSCRVCYVRTTVPGWRHVTLRQHVAPPSPRLLRVRRSRTSRSRASRSGSALPTPRAVRVDAGRSYLPKRQPSGTCLWTSPWRSGSSWTPLRRPSTGMSRWRTTATCSPWDTSWPSQRGSSAWDKQRGPGRQMEKPQRGADQNSGKLMTR